MNISKTLVLLVTAMILLCCLTTAVSARYTPPGEADNAGINNGDTIYRGEVNLNFSSFGTPDHLTLIGGVGSIIPITSLHGTIPSTATTGAYSVCSLDGSELGVCNIAELNPEILVSPAFPPSSGISEQFPENIVKSTAIIFSIKDDPLRSNGLSGNWCSATIKNEQTSATRDYITNINGDTITLTNLQNPFDKTNLSYAFRFVEQGGFVPTSGAVPMSVTFSISLNGLNKKITREFQATDTQINIADATISAGESGSLKFTGIPFETFNIYFENTANNTPYFTSGEHITIIDKHTIAVTPMWNGNLSIPVIVPIEADAGRYPVTMTYSGIKYSANVIVDKASSMVGLIFDPAPQDATEGRFATGDAIKLRGTVTGAQANIPIYIYITGRGLPENGANLETRQEVVDGDASTFTITSYSIILGHWEYFWSTGGYQPGTYTIHASLLPVGYKKSSDPSDEHHKSVSHEYVISDQSISIKSNEDTSNYFTKGNSITYNISALGSPGTNGGSTGTIRWYIIGPNYKYADWIDKYPLFENPNDIGTKAPLGNVAIKYNRSFSTNLDPGTYSLIVQHPGYDGKFDITPNSNTGPITSVNTSDGGMVNLGELQTQNALYALTELLSSSKYDDLYVITEIIIEDPKISIDQLENLQIGDAVTIQGTTNYYTTDTFSLKIDKVDFSNPDNNMAMLVSTERIHPASAKPYAKYLQRSFKFKDIDTSTWYPGMYEATVTNIDTGFKKTMTFNVGMVNENSENRSLQADYDPSLSTEPLEPILEPTLDNKAPSLDFETTTSNKMPTPTKSPGFILTIPGLLLGLLVTIRRK